MALDMYYRYFVYSAEQKKLNEEIFKKANKSYQPGSILIRGKHRLFTDILLDMKQSKYSDSQIVAQGDIRSFTFTNPSR